MHCGSGRLKDATLLGDASKGFTQAHKQEKHTFTSPNLFCHNSRQVKPLILNAPQCNNNIISSKNLLWLKRTNIMKVSIWTWPITHINYNYTSLVVYYTGKWQICWAVECCVGTISSQFNLGCQMWSANIDFGLGMMAANLTTSLRQEDVGSEHAITVLGCCWKKKSSITQPSLCVPSVLYDVEDQYPVLSISLLWDVCI